MMIVSIGLGLAARYLFLYLFGGRSQAYRPVRGAVADGLRTDLAHRA